MGCDPLGDPGAELRTNDNGWNDGLLYYDPDFAENRNQRIYPTKRFSTLGQFSRYVRPGDRRHDVSGAPRGLRILVFSRSPDSTPAATAPIQVPGRTRLLQPVQRPVNTSARPTDRWTVVVINTTPAGTSGTALELQLPAPKGMRIVPDDAIGTDAHHDLEPVELPEVSASGLVRARLPAQSITTYVLKATGGA
jgi:hypothetical protein